MNKLLESAIQNKPAELAVALKEALDVKAREAVTEALEESFGGKTKALKG